MLPKICTIPECGKRLLARGWCGMHYKRWQTNGDNANWSASEERYYDREQAFTARLKPSDGCIEWSGWISPDGYGKFKTGGKSVFAHRYAWERVHGPIPDGLVIDHACRNTACVNVDHLRLATQSENTRNLSGAKSNNKHSGARNVGRMGNRWRVRITKDGTVHAFGCYDTLEQARAVAEAGRAELFGEFAGKG